MALSSRRASHAELFEIESATPPRGEYSPVVRFGLWVVCSASVLVFFGWFPAVIWDIPARMLPSTDSLDKLENGQAGHGVIDCNGDACVKTHLTKELYEREKAFYRFAKEDADGFRKVVAAGKLAFNDGLNQITIDNLGYRMRAPMLADLKVGKQTYSSSASLGKKMKMWTIDVANGNRITGIRIAGMTKSTSRLSTVFDTWNLKKQMKQYLNTKQLVSAYIDQLKIIIDLFKENVRYKFVGMSLFSVYDKCKTDLKLRLIDFAQTTEVRGGHVDNNVLKGLLHLEELIEQISKEISHRRRLDQDQGEGICKPSRSTSPLIGGVMTAIILVLLVSCLVFVYWRRDRGTHHDSILPEFFHGRVSSILRDEECCNW